MCDVCSLCRFLLWSWGSPVRKHLWFLWAFTTNSCGNFYSYSASATSMVFTSQRRRAMILDLQCLFLVISLISIPSHWAGDTQVIREITSSEYQIHRGLVNTHVLSDKRVNHPPGVWKITLFSKEGANDSWCTEHIKLITQLFISLSFRTHWAITENLNST